MSQLEQEMERIAGRGSLLLKEYSRKKIASSGSAGASEVANEVFLPLLREFGAIERKRWVYCPQHGDSMKPVVFGKDNHFMCTHIGCGFEVKACD